MSRAGIFGSAHVSAASGVIYEWDGESTTGWTAYLDDAGGGGATEAFMEVVDGTLRCTANAGGNPPAGVHGSIILPTVAGHTYRATGWCTRGSNRYLVWVEFGDQSSPASSPWQTIADQPIDLTFVADSASTELSIWGADSPSSNASTTSVRAWDLKVVEVVEEG